MFFYMHTQFKNPSHQKKIQLKLYFVNMNTIENYNLFCFANFWYCVVHNPPRPGETIFVLFTNSHESDYDYPEYQMSMHEVLFKWVNDIVIMIRKNAVGWMCCCPCVKKVTRWVCQSKELTHQSFYFQALFIKEFRHLGRLAAQHTQLKLKHNWSSKPVDPMWDKRTR